MLILLAACAGPSDPAIDSPPAPVDTSDSGGLTTPYEVTATVTLDGTPVEGAIVMQGGGRDTWTTNAAGVATVTVDPAVVGDQVVLASHADARIAGEVVDGPGAVEIDLVSFDPSDNPDFTFADPGPESHEDTTTAQCGHCHLEIHHGWYASPHRTAASNPALQDLYSGTTQASDEASCVSSGGAWAEGAEPGTGEATERCFLGAGVRTDTEGTGGCADCHAPGIDGELGGRDLLDATGIAYDAGVHCDVCHHVESVDLDAAPGVAGRLHVLRPTEPATSPGMGAWAPLTFGPLVDVVNPRMGSVYRELFHTAELCAGCHEQEQAVLVPGEDVDRSRWPDGVLPVHSTYSEWEEGPMNPSAPCQSCHMPPMPYVGNAADLYNEFNGVLVGISAGWERAPGEVRGHNWYGPRQPESGMLESAAALDVVARVEDGEVIADVTVTNSGPGHALPTGEPLRAMILLVDATCDGAALAPSGGDVVPDYGGAWDEKVAGDDWEVWPGAEVGDLVRVATRDGTWRDYEGFGPFGDGRFSSEEKGLPTESWAGEATIVATDGDRVTFDTPLPEGDVAWRVSGSAYAGVPGFAFARVLVGADGARMVPHFLAVDVASDNRLLPTRSFTTTHRFAATCDTPSVHASLIHRNYPIGLAEERGWALSDQLMTEAWR